MKMLIISYVGQPILNYDSVHNFTIMDNGVRHTGEEIVKNRDGHFYDILDGFYHHDYDDIKDFILTEYGKDYDKIIVCVNGDVDMLK